MHIVCVSVKSRGNVVSCGFTRGGVWLHQVWGCGITRDGCVASPGLWVRYMIACGFSKGGGGGGGPMLKTAAEFIPWTQPTP